MSKKVVFWFRRDLRFEDNVGLFEAAKQGLPIVPVFIFDKNILSELPKKDARVSFIYKKLHELNTLLNNRGRSLVIYHDTPIEAWVKIVEEFEIESVYTNHDYEPYAIERDKEVSEFLKDKDISFQSFKDQVIFECNEVLKSDGAPYTVFTPYKKRWLENLTKENLGYFPAVREEHFLKLNRRFPSISEIGFEQAEIKVPDYNLSNLANYLNTRNIPAKDGTSHLSVHLRFGTMGIRSVVEKVLSNESFLNELIWREFFMQILFHFPDVVHSNFRSKYNGIKWRNNEKEFERWKKGLTGYPLVDAGMRELNTTGYMHNRVRMVAAGFLCKDLLIDWRWGEAYFAEKLLDFELSSNNGNWQWSAGTGCDAAPYFRIFNPTEQLKKFDKKLEYVRKWVPEVDSLEYPPPIVDHKKARERALRVYKEGMKE